MKTKTSFPALTKEVRSLWETRDLEPETQEFDALVAGETSAYFEDAIELLQLAWQRAFGGSFSEALADAKSMLELPPEDHWISPALILYLRFFEELTLAETAKLLKVSATHIRNKEARAISRLRMRNSGTLFAFYGTANGFKQPAFE